LTKQKNQQIKTKNMAGQMRDKSFHAGYKYVTKAKFHNFSITLLKKEVLRSFLPPEKHNLGWIKWTNSGKWIITTNSKMSLFYKS
jgi:hypothetical protein